jgi:hypothetical protein
MNRELMELDWTTGSASAARTVNSCSSMLNRTGASAPSLITRSKYVLPLLNWMRVRGCLSVHVRLFVFAAVQLYRPRELMSIVSHRGGPTGVP